MKANDIREKNVAELKKMATDLKEELFRLHFKHSVGQLEKVSSIRVVQRDIARVKTVINEKTKPEA